MGLIRPEDPVWYDPLSPLGSAVRHVAALSPRFHWVGIYVLKGDALELGPFMGADTEHRRIPVGQGICGRAVSAGQDQNIPEVGSDPDYLACSVETRSELVVLIRDANGRILGQIDIDSHVPAAFGPDEEAAVRRIARELGERRPKLEN